MPTGGTEPKVPVANEAGQSAREKAEELRAEQSTFIRVAAAAFGVHTEERAWRRGARGEELVGKSLAKLPDGWVVLHDLLIGSKGANLDHLVIGPPGVFALNTKHHSGTVTVYDKAILHNGTRTFSLPKTRSETKKVARRLSAAAGFEVEVTSVLVFVGSIPDVKNSPPDVKVVPRLKLRRWLKRRKGLVLTPDQVLLIASLATEPTNWFPNATPRRPDASPPAVPVDRPGAAATPVPEQVPDAPTPASESSGPAEQPPEPDASPVGDGEVVVRPWKRYGHDRLYVNGPDGTRLGWLDRSNGAVHLEDPAHAAVVREALAAWEPPSRP